MYRNTFESSKMAIDELKRNDVLKDHVSMLTTSKGGGISTNYEDISSPTHQHQLCMKGGAETSTLQHDWFLPKISNDISPIEQYNYLSYYSNLVSICTSMSDNQQFIELFDDAFKGNVFKIPYHSSGIQSKLRKFFASYFRDDYLKIIARCFDKKESGNHIAAIEALKVFNRIIVIPILNHTSYANGEKLLTEQVKRNEHTYTEEIQYFDKLKQHFETPADPKNKSVTYIELYGQSTFTSKRIKLAHINSTWGLDADGLSNLHTAIGRRVVDYVDSKSSYKAFLNKSTGQGKQTLFDDMVTLKTDIEDARVKNTEVDENDERSPRQQWTRKIMVNFQHLHHHHHHHHRLRKEKHPQKQKRPASHLQIHQNH